MSMEGICKYKHSGIILSLQSSDQPESVRQLLEELDSFDKEVTAILDDMSQVDQSIAAFKSNCDEMATKLNGLGSVASSLTNGNSDRVKGLMALAALATKVYGSALAKQKQENARIRYNAQMDALLQKKQEIASLKLPKVTNLLERFRNTIAPRFECLYSNDWNKIVDLSDQLLMSHISLFKRNFSLVIKSRYLMNVIQYCIDEMNAWNKGKQDSGLKQPSVDKVIEKEFSNWPARLGGKGQSWNSLMIDALNQGEGEMPLPVLMVISDPCLMRNYIGVNIGDSDNCSHGLIYLDHDRLECINPVADSNLYLNHCRNIYANDNNPPSKVMGFSIVDCLILVALPLTFFLVLVLIFSLEHSVFWRIFFILPALCWLGLGIEHLEDNYDNIFPYVRRINRYNSAVDAYMKSICAKEDCKEFHVL